MPSCRSWYSASMWEIHQQQSRIDVASKGLLRSKKKKFNEQPRSSMRSFPGYSSLRHCWVKYMFRTSSRSVSRSARHPNFTIHFLPPSFCKRNINYTLPPAMSDVKLALVLNMFVHEKASLLNLACSGYLFTFTPCRNNSYFWLVRENFCNGYL